MKTLLITLAICLFLSAPSQAEKSWQEKCATVGIFAEIVMENRQAGVSMAKMMELTDADAVLSHEIIINAYSSPRYSTERVQKREVENYRDRWYLDCVRALRD